MAMKIALAGNPNCGKTTLFNALTGANQYVGNWPGVTVEKKEGRLRGKRKKEEILVTDLPGVYSLSPYTLEEVVSRDYLLSGEPDVIVDLVDATNIERNLYLTTQLIETGVPVVIALNMADLLEKRDSKAVEQVPLSDKAARAVDARRQALESARDTDMESLITDERYAYIQKIASAAVKKSGRNSPSPTGSTGWSPTGCWASPFLWR